MSASSCKSVVRGVIADEDGVLLVQKTNGRWDMPGGKVDEGEDPRKALHREIKEETGVEVRNFTHMGSVPHPFLEGVNVDYYLCHGATGIAANLEPDELQSVTRKPFNESASLLMGRLPENIASYISCPNRAHRLGQLSGAKLAL